MKVAATSCGNWVAVILDVVTTDGRFSPERFAEQATTEQVKMIEIKLSQGAKPGHGGILPGKEGDKVEIAATRGVPEGAGLCFAGCAHRVHNAARDDGIHQAS